MTKNHILSDLQLAFIGAGAMGEAMIAGLLSRHDLEPAHIVASDRHRERLDALRETLRIDVTLDNGVAAGKGQVVDAAMVDGSSVLATSVHGGLASGLGGQAEWGREHVVRRFLGCPD